MWCQRYKVCKWISLPDALWKKKIPEPQTLPPTEDFLSLHLGRTNFVVKVWKLSLETHPIKLNPTAYGSTGGNQGPQIKWIGKNPALDSLLDYISSNCKANNSCSTQRCRCGFNGFKCTVVCTYSNYQNSMRGNENEKDKNEYVKSEDDSDFETENYSSGNEFM